MKLSIIIPCLNAEPFIAHQLDALSSQNWDEPWEVVISDNGCTDRTLSVVEQFKHRLPKLRVVDASDASGQPHALNVGIRAAASESVAFCDADDEVGCGWVKAMGEALKKYDFVAGRFDFKKLNPKWLNASHPQEKGLNKYRYPSYLYHAGSGNMGVKKSLHLKAQGFDESMPYLFDTDYCFKLQLSGVQLKFIPDAVAHIRTNVTLGDTYRKGTSNGEYNVLLYKRYRPLGMPKLSWKNGFIYWGNVLKSLPRVRSKKGLNGWMWQFCWGIGRVKGSIRWHILAL